MDLREIIVWLGLIAIAVILWDGLRRMKLNKVKTKSIDDDYEDPEELARKAQLARELPNGGARVRSMTDSEKDDLSSRINLRERVPMLMERVEVSASEPEKESITASIAQSELDFTLAMAEPVEEQGLSVEASTDGTQPSNEPVSHESHPDPEVIDSDVDNETHDENAFEAGLELESSGGDIESLSEIDEYKLSDDLESANAESDPVSVREPEARIDPGPVEDLVVIHVMAKKEGELSGSQVLELLLTAGLRHGPMDIFHYRNPQGYTEFSLANCVQPGIFDPDSMNQVNTPGVTLFMQLPTAADAMESFDHMYEMARYLAGNLGAEILDEDHSSVTPQRLEYYREKLRTFARSKLIHS